MEFLWGSSKFFWNFYIDFDCARNNRILLTLHILCEVPSLHEATQDIPEDKSSLVISSTSDKLYESDTDSSSGDEYTSSEIFDFEQELGFTDKTELQIAENILDPSGNRNVLVPAGVTYAQATSSSCFDPSVKMGQKSGWLDSISEYSPL